MTSRGTAGGRFTRAIQQRNLWAAEMSLREMGQAPTLEYALAYLDLLAEQKPEKLERAAVRSRGLLARSARRDQLRGVGGHLGTQRDPGERDAVSATALV